MFLLYCFIAMRSHHFQFQFIALSNRLHMRPVTQYHQFQPQRLSDGDEAHCSWISCAVSVISHFAVFFTTIIPQMEIFTVNTGQNAKMPPTHDSKTETRNAVVFRVRNVDRAARLYQPINELLSSSQWLIQRGRWGGRPQ